MSTDKQIWDEAIAKCPLLSKLCAEHVGPKQPQPSVEMIEKHRDTREMTGYVSSELLNRQRNNIFGENNAVLQEEK